MTSHDTAAVAVVLLRFLVTTAASAQFETGKEAMEHHSIPQKGVGEMNDVQHYQQLKLHKIKNKKSKSISYHISLSIAIPKVQYTKVPFFGYVGSASAIPAPYASPSTSSNLPPWKRAVVEMCCVPCHLATNMVNIDPSKITIKIHQW
jgi:hypothetical protein